MSVITNFFEQFTKRPDSSFIYDLDLAQQTSNKLYMKKLAVSTVIGFVARSFSQSEFRVMNGTNQVKGDWYYKFNVRPNTDLSSTNFWQELIYKLIHDNEVLVILNNTNDLLIADSFVRKESANYPDTFSGVVVKNYQFQRTFDMDEVWYMSYNNEDLDTFLTGLWSDYGELFGRMIAIQMRNNQIRATVKANITRGTQEEDQKKLQTFINKIFKSFQKNSVAIVPLTNDFEYNELTHTTGSSSSQPFKEVNDIQNAFMDDVANLIGVPPALIHGQMAEVDENSEAFNKYCLNPLIKKVEAELNAKIFSKSDYLKGWHVRVIGPNHKTILESADAIATATSSGAIKIDEVREPLGLDPLPNGEGQKVLVTKNFTNTDETTKGGENE